MPKAAWQQTLCYAPFFIKPVFFESHLQFSVFQVVFLRRHISTMAMIASLHVQDSMQPPEELAATSETNYTEFNIFRDYFGLHTIVKSIAAENAPLDECTEFEESEDLESYPCRRNSLDSSISEFSSNSLESTSVEVADICFNYNHDVRATQAFSEMDVEPLSPLGGPFESPLGGPFEMCVPKTNIPPSLFLSHTKLHTINISAHLKKPQVC